LLRRVVLFIGLLLIVRLVEVRNSIGVFTNTVTLVYLTVDIALTKTVRILFAYSSF